jgi:DNA topoisomerase-1
MKLVIVETSAQAKTLSTHLGEGWRVEPCYGFVRYLPPNELGIDLEDGFRPTFSIVKGKGGLVVRLKKLLREAEAIYAATSPGNEGEAMAWHVIALEPSVTEKKRPVYRVMLDALTADAIREAFASPLPLDMNRVEAALTVGIADRLAGYIVNTAASKAVGIEMRLTYAGMVALRYLANHEVAASHSYWLSSVRFTVGSESFAAKILNSKGKPLALRTEAQVEQLRRMLQHASYWVERLGGTTRSHAAPDPLTLSTLIETVTQELGLSAARTLSLISTLYEAGQISHPDGILPASSTEVAQAYIRQEFGEAYLAPTEPVVNGIAPVDVNHRPEDIAGEGAELYSMIWRYFVAAHMTPAQERIAAARLRVGPARDKPYPITLLAQAREFVFDGWLRVFKDRKPDEMDERLPLLKEGVAIRPARAELVLDQRRMAERFDETSLTLALIRLGFGPQPAAEAILHLRDSNLVSVDGDVFALTENGLRSATTLRESFAKPTDPAYAAKFLANVDAVAAGEVTRADVLRAFWSQMGDGRKPDTGSSPAPAKKPAVSVREAQP